MVRESVVRVCACGGVTSLQIPWAWNFLTNSIQTPLASSLCKFYPAFHLSKQQHPNLDANTPLKSWGVAAVSDGVFVFWYILDGEELVEKKIHLDGIPKFSWTCSGFRPVLSRVFSALSLAGSFAGCPK